MIFSYPKLFFWTYYGLATIQSALAVPPQVTNMQVSSTSQTFTERYNNAGKEFYWGSIQTGGTAYTANDLAQIARNCALRVQLLHLQRHQALKNSKPKADMPNLPTGIAVIQDAFNKYIVVATVQVDARNPQIPHDSNFIHAEVNAVQLWHHLGDMNPDPMGGMSVAFNMRHGGGVMAACGPSNQDCQKVLSDQDMRDASREVTVQLPQLPNNPGAPGPAQQGTSHTPPSGQQGPGSTPSGHQRGSSRSPSGRQQGTGANQRGTNRSPSGSHHQHARSTEYLQRRNLLDLFTKRDIERALERGMQVRRAINRRNSLLKNRMIEDMYRREEPNFYELLEV